MGGRDVPFDEREICDECGAIGAYDFMGDLLCPLCAHKAIGEPESCNRCGCKPCECGGINANTPPRAKD